MVALPWIIATIADKIFDKNYILLLGVLWTWDPWPTLAACLFTFNFNQLWWSYHIHLTTWHLCHNTTILKTTIRNTIMAMGTICMHMWKHRAKSEEFDGGISCCTCSSLSDLKKIAIKNLRNPYMQRKIQKRSGVLQYVLSVDWERYKVPAHTHHHYI